MSSSRSIAAARQRRAGEPAPISQQRPPVTSINSQKAFAPQQQQEGPGQIPQVPVGKLSIGDAFALVTIRLGRVESIIQKLEADGFIGANAQPPNSSEMEHDENMRLVTDTVIRNIVNRLGDLEKNQTKLTTTTNSMKGDIESIRTQITTTPSAVVNSEVQNQIMKLKMDLMETKELLMKLQSFTMETNQKMASIVLTQENIKVSLPTTTQPNEVPIKEEEYVHVHDNLKQIIENELNNANFNEESNAEVEEETD